MFVLSNRLAGRYTPATELDLIRFQTLPLGGLMWNPSTQVNNGILAAYITDFELMGGKRRRFITFLIYSLVYPGIDSNLVTLANLSPWSESVCTRTYYTFLRKPLLR